MPKKKKVKREINLRNVVKAAILVLTISVFGLLFLALLVPRESDVIKGVTYDLSYPATSHYSQVPVSVFEEDFKLMKKAGINTLRLYGIPPEFILDLAEKYKFKVIETIAFPGEWTDFTSPYQLKALKRDAVRNIRRDKDRECVYAWGIWNDAPWTYGSGKGDVTDVYGEDAVSRFLREIYKTVKMEDPLRPVIGATLAMEPDLRRLGADFLDILGFNVYLGVTDWIGGGYDSGEAERIVDELALLRKEYGKPVIITEAGYSTFWTRDEQEGVLGEQISKALKKLDGIIIFQWADNWSKAGNSGLQDRHVEEHWGVVEGDRSFKNGYYVLKRLFRNTILKETLFAISDYFKGSYLTARKRALRSGWREKRFVDGGRAAILVNKLKNPSHFNVPEVLERLSEAYFEKSCYDQFADLLKGNRSLYDRTRYLGLVDYYTVLARWKKLEHLCAIGDWETYFAEKTRELPLIFEEIETLLKDTGDKETYLKALYLKWDINNELLTGREDTILSLLEDSCIAYAKDTKDTKPLLAYSKLLKAKAEQRASDRLLRTFVEETREQWDPEDALAIFKTEAEGDMDDGNTHRAKILYDAYVNMALDYKPEEEISFTILEISAAYRGKAQYNESIALCERLLQEFPNSELADDAAYNIAFTFKEKGLYDEAVASFKDFIHTFPGSELSKNAVKEALTILSKNGGGKDKERSISFLREIIGMYAEGIFLAQARYELALILESLGRHTEAQREYQYIIDNFPTSEYAIYSKKRIKEALSL
ncbi:MAG: tetratricopeptide repeat protein [Candidatus Omnitrophica bacterium]|nr:tetratricopeptide repeat protein [Candidatus Omnitrophota bacterium]